MIETTARILKNVIEVQAGPELWVCRPVQAGAPGLGNKIAALFSTEYHTFRPAAPGEVHSTVSYHARSDEIRIQVGPDKWRTESQSFRPTVIQYRGTHYVINEKLTGRFAILNGETPVAIGELGFRSCKIHDYPEDLEWFLANLSLGYVIRTLFWEMFR